MTDNEFDNQINAARQAFAQGRPEEAFQACRGLLAANPPLDEAWGAVSDIALECHDFFGAFDARRRQLAAQPRSLDAGNKTASLAAECGRFETAKHLAAQLSEQAPDNPVIHNTYGWILGALGEFDASEREYRRATELKPGLGGAWYGLSRHGFLPADDQTLARMKAGVGEVEDDDPQARLHALGTLHFAIADTHRRRGEADDAFAWYMKGAEYCGPAAPPDAEKHFQKFRAMRDALNADRLLGKGEGHRTDRPIFVTGMPRTGTTLMQQILTAHPDVTEGAEASHLHTAALPIWPYNPERIDAYLAASANQPGGPWARAGRAFMALSSERFGNTGRFVDKNLGNPTILGVALAALPDAKFIWMRRKPGPTALSNFTHFFSRGLWWTWRLEDIALQMRAYEAFLAHWQTLFPDRILVVDYEDLTEDPDGQIDRILDYCGLSRDPAVKNFHEQESAVATFSVAQVRQPIRADKSESWRAFETHLKPFFDTYETAGALFGESLDAPSRQNLI